MQYVQRIQRCGTGGQDGAEDSGDGGQRNEENMNVVMNTKEGTDRRTISKDKSHLYIGREPQQQPGLICSTGRVC